MARRGAKRKNRGYTPGHKPVNDPVEQLDHGTPELQAQRARCVGEAYIRAWDGSLLHQWFLSENIGRSEYDAGRKFDAVAKRFRSLICAPNPDAGEHARRAPGIDDPEAFAKARDAYEGAYEAMGSRRTQRAVADLLRDTKPESFDYARDGLKKLAKHWGM